MQAESTGARRGRVGSTGPAYAYIGLLWVLLPSGWPPFLVLLIYAVGDFDPEPMAFAVGFALLTVVSVWLLVAFAGRNARPLPDGSGLRIRSFFRSYEVPWNAVRDVRSTEMDGSSRSFSFSKTIVKFTDASAAKPLEVVVRMSWRAGSAGAQEIESWAPTDHALRGADPDRHTRPAVPDVPIPDVLLPDPVYRRVMVGLGTVLTLVAAVGGLVCSGQGGTPGAVGAVLCAVAALVCVIATVQAATAKVVIEPTRLISRAPFRVRVFSVDEIHSFQENSYGLSSVARVILNGRGSRMLAVGASYGNYSDEVVKTLSAWLAQARARSASHASP